MAFKFFEWDVETIEGPELGGDPADPEILDHWRAYTLSTYPDQILRACAEGGGNFRLCMVRDIRKADDSLARSWCYLKPSASYDGLPKFDGRLLDAGGQFVGEVPRRFIEELRIYFRMAIDTGIKPVL